MSEAPIFNHDDDHVPSSDLVRIESMLIGTPDGDIELHHDLGITDGTVTVEIDGGGERAYDVMGVTINSDGTFTLDLNRQG